jgi:ABC-type uncharacterized transport system involved in gliding motility auxiliary subunit
LKALATSNYVIKKSDFKMLVELWPGFFNGETRSEYNLYRQMKTLAEKKGLIFKIESRPPRDKTNWKRTREKQRSPRISKNKIYEQIR